MPKYKSLITAGHSEKGAIPVLVLIAIVGLIAFLIFSGTASFKNSFLTSLFPKPPSHAASDPISGPINSPSPNVGEVRNMENGFTLQGYKMDGTTPGTAFLIGDKFKVKVKVASDYEASYKFLAKINFPIEKLKAISINTDNSFIQNWTDKSMDNSTGRVSLIGTVPGSGLMTDPKKPRVLMATIVFQALTSGDAKINLGPATAMLRKSDNANVLTTRNNLSVKIIGSPN